MLSGRRTAGAVFAVAAALVGIVPASVQAAAFYVNDDGGNDSNACTVTSAPCLTLAGGIARAQQSPGAGDTISVDGGAYAASDLNFGDGNSLQESDFNPGDGDTQATITGASNGGAIRVNPGDPAGNIEGFDFVHNPGGFGALITLRAAATVQQNTFTGMSSTGGTSGIEIDTASPTVTQNSFSSTQGGVAIVSSGGGSPAISLNSFTGAYTAIQSIGGSPAISQNTITGTADPADFGDATAIAADGDATITRNSISGSAPGSFAVGISVRDPDLTSGPPVNATLARNRVSGHRFGYRITNSTVSMNGDMAVANRYGLGVFGDIDTSVSANNITLYDNDVAAPGSPPTDVRLSSATLALDSSIVESPIDVSGGSACTISFSRGPTTSGTACEQFQTTAAPSFVNPAGGDYHLGDLSALRDAGNPAAPVAPNDVDIDGDPRVRNGDCQLGARRDIGADEAAPRLAECDPPETTIDSGPEGQISGPTASFAFSSDEPGSSFECRIDGGNFGSCSGPGATHITAALAEGSHSFEVRATDPVGNTDPSPASRTFVVADPPETTIDSGPEGQISGPTASFAFSSDEPGSSFECRIDGGNFGSCSGPGATHITAALAEGSHSFEVRAIDAAGNSDPSPASRSFVVANPPETTIIKSPPKRLVTEKRRVKVKLSFESDEPGSGFQCKLDKGDFMPCDEGRFKAKVKPGRHVFFVRAVDPARNVDSTPASSRWRVVRA